MSKTPQFDAALLKVWSSFVPGIKSCAECAQDFEISSEDVVLLKKLGVPPFARCYDCRRRNRLAFLNYTSLYRRPCDAEGHDEQMISSIPPESPYPVYDYDAWFDKNWEPFSFGEDPGVGSLKAQFLSLLGKVPHPALTRHKGSVGSDYTLYGFNFKDCYFTFGGMNAENVHYSNWPINTRDSLDLLMVGDSQLSSNSVYLADCFKVHFVYFSSDCIESEFLYDCKNVSNCFGSVNLRNKKYVFFNEQLSKEEYEKRRGEIDLGDRETFRRYSKKFWDLVKSSPVRAARNVLSENVTGNYITRSKNCHMVVRAAESENVRYSDYVVRIKDSMDVAISASGELHYGIAAVSANSAGIKFSFNVRTSTDSEFLANCINVSNCFMSTGLENKKFCILNKQYTEEEYWPLLDQLKTQMLEAGEYGEFLPMSSSPYAYNGSLAQIVYPLTREEATVRGILWHDEGEQNTGGLGAVSLRELPQNIKDIGDDILMKAIQGDEGKAFRLIKPELEFYRTHSLPIPDKHPYNRILDRFASMNNLRLVGETCSSCGVSTLSSYKKSDGYTVLCESCFNARVA